MLNRISQSWKDSLSKDVHNKVRFYLDPRRVECPNFTGTNTYYTNTVADPVNGQYSLDQSTGKYMAPFYMPMTFEIYFKPQFAYDVATDQEFYSFMSDTYNNARVSLCYYAATDQIGIKCYTSTGGASVTQLDVKLAKVYTSNAELQKWIRLTCTVSTAGISIYSDGGNVITDATNIATHKAKVFLVPGNNVDCLINYSMICYGVVATAAQIAAQYEGFEYECWFIDFQGVGLARTRCDVTHKAKSYTHEYKDGYTSAEMSLSLMNNNGEFSADQYGTFAPQSYSYNGTYLQKYLASNDVGLSMEYRSKKKTVIDCPLAGYYPMTGFPDIPDNAAGTTYVEKTWATTSGFVYSSGTLSVSPGRLRATRSSIGYVTKNVGTINARSVRLRVHASKDIIINLSYYNGSVYTVFKTQSVTKDWAIVDTYLASGSTDNILYISASWTAGDWIEIASIYVGTGLYDTLVTDYTGSGKDFTATAVYPCYRNSSYGLCFNGSNAFLQRAVTDFTTTGAFSFSCWISGETRTTTQYLFTRDGGAGVRGIATVIDANNRPYFAVSGDATNFIAVSGSAGSEITSDCMLTFVYVPSTGLYIYKNGVEIKKNTTSIPAAIYYNASQTLKIGALGAGTGGLKGWVDDARIYTGALTAAQVLTIYNESIDTSFQPDTDAPFEQAFIGTADRGAFSRNVSVGGMPMVSITANDAIKAMAKKKISRAQAFEDYYFSRATPANNSLIHEFIWMASNRDVTNLLGNSGFENATIANSWVAGGVSPTFARSNTVALFGTYSGYLTGTSGLYVRQSVTLDLSVGVKYTFQIYVYAASALTITPKIYEYQDSTLIATSTNATTAAGTGWQLYTVEHYVTASASNKLTVELLTSASGVYMDMAMLTVGGVKYFYAQNTNDGAAGVISYRDAMTTSYKTIGIDAEDVAYQHPWAIVKTGETAYEHSKQMSDATICRNYGVNQSGVFKYRSHLASDISPLPIGSIGKTSSISATNQPLSANKIVCEGVRLEVSTFREDNTWQASTAIMDMSESESFFRVELANGEVWPDPVDHPEGLECVIVQ